MADLYFHSFESEIGRIKTAATDSNLVGVALPNESDKSFRQRMGKYFLNHNVNIGGSINKEAEKQIVKYLRGTLDTFTLPLDIQGTAFQKKVLKKVSQIHYGKTRSYADIAKAVGSPKAYRAVGSANAKNNLPIVIPCHRVVSSNGLGGYAGGLKLKQRLLDLEISK